MSFFVPLFAPLSIHLEAYTHITLGAFVSALSPIFLLFGNQYWNAIGYVVVLSIGESLWNPRLYDYCFNYIERGREGSFIALTSAPFFVSLLITGSLSGFLLSNLCPEKGDRQPQLMWGIIMLLSILFPLLLVVFRPALEEREKLDQKEC